MTRPITLANEAAHRELRDECTRAMAEPLRLPSTEPGELLDYLCCSALMFALGWGLFAGPALLGVMLGIGIVALVAWEVVRHWAELREWWG